MNGAVRVAVLLTTCSDIAARPSPPNGLAFEDLFTRASPGGDCPHDFYTKLTYGTLTLTGQVFGWFPGIDENGQPLTSTKLASYPGGGDPARQQRVRAGIRGAQRIGINLDSFDVFVVVPNFAVDGFGGQNAVPELGRTVGAAFLDQGGWFTGNASHELGHALGLEHSFAPYGEGNDASGVYGDPFDIMSANNCFSVSGADGMVESGLSAASLLLQGWVPAGRLVTIGDGAVGGDQLVTLAALGHPEAAGALAIRVVSPGWPYNGSQTWTVEFRRKDGFDAGLPHDVVLVHQLGYSSNNPHLVSVPAGDAGRTQLPQSSAAVAGLTPSSGTWVSPDGLEVTVESINPVANTAVVRLGNSTGHLETTGSQRVQTVFHTVIRGVYHFPGGPFENQPGQPCAPRDYVFSEYTVTQEVTATVTRVGISSGRELQWTLNDHAVSPGASSIVLDNVYPATTATLDCTLSGDTLTVVNHASDGSFRIWVDCFPTDPEERGKGGSTLLFDFDPDVKVFEPDYAKNMNECAQIERAYLGALVSRLRTVPQSVPHGGDPEQQLIERIEQRVRSLPGLKDSMQRAAQQIREQDGPSSDRVR